MRWQDRSRGRRGARRARALCRRRSAADGLFLAIGTAGSSELARKIGAMLDGADVKVDVHQATNVPGLFAAGDCTGGLLQVAKAVHEGAEAGLSALRYVRSKRNAK